MKDNTELLNDIAKSIPRDEYNELEHAWMKQLIIENIVIMDIQMRYRSCYRW